MKFLIDAQLSPAMCRWSAAHGHDVVHVRDILTHNAPDREIAEVALAETRIVVSKDADFIPISLRTGVRVLLLRCGNIRPRPLSSCLEERWATIESRLLGQDSIVEIH